MALKMPVIPPREKRWEEAKSSTLKKQIGKRWDIQSGRMRIVSVQPSDDWVIIKNKKKLFLCTF